MCIRPQCCLAPLSSPCLSAVCWLTVFLWARGRPLTAAGRQPASQVSLPCLPENTCYPASQCTSASGTFTFQVINRQPSLLNKCDITVWSPLLLQRAELFYFSCSWEDQRVEFALTNQERLTRHHFQMMQKLQSCLLEQVIQGQSGDGGNMTTTTYGNDNDSNNTVTVITLLLLLFYFYATSQPKVFFKTGFKAMLCQKKEIKGEKQEVIFLIRMRKIV